MEQGRGDATATGFIIPFLPVAILGGMGIGALVGSMSGESSNESKSTFISLEDKTLDEKINFFKSRSKAMKRLFTIPILFALIFSQSKNNQNYYRISIPIKKY